ncbi:MAG: dTMP kinase [Candidatus Nanohalarchaeota archaeon]|nr:MAG: dTMP kinase [Candidatus Nanohaloarchaeota archaeon]
MTAPYIVIEGMDGSGKTTQAKLLIDFLKNHKFKVYHNIEPSQSPIGKHIQQMIKSTASRPETTALAFALDRMLSYDQNLKYAKEKYDYIIADRSYLSSLAYQPLQGCRYDWIKELNRYVEKPDIVFLLDIPPEEFTKRRGKTKVIFENEDFQRKLRHSYLSLKENLPLDIIILDGTKPKYEIHERIRELTVKL